jgi:uncharacterized protein YndB with AHSA1/START domain
VQIIRVKRVKGRNGAELPNRNGRARAAAQEGKWRTIMNETNLIAKASATIGAPAAKVWDALVNPDLIKLYMFGATVISDWKKGSPIVWKGEWKGSPYEDKGVILEIEPQRQLRYSHFSPLMGLPDVPENYHNVTIDLAASAGGTQVTITQDNNRTTEAQEHSEKNWATMLTGLKKTVES